MTIQTPVRSAFASVYDADNNKVADCPDAATAAELVGMVNGREDDTPIDEAWLRSIGFESLRYQGNVELVLKFRGVSDLQWIEVCPSSCTHGWFSIRRISDEMIDAQLPPDIVEVNCKTQGAMLNLLRALGIQAKGPTHE